MKTSRLVALLGLLLATGCHSLEGLPRREANELLHGLRDSYRQQDAGAFLTHYDRAFVAVDFRASPSGEDPGGGVDVRRGVGDIDRASFARSLQAELASYESVARAKSVLYGMRALEDVEGADEAYEVDALFRIWATTKGGRRHYEDRDLRLTLVREEGGPLRVRAQRILERTVVRGDGREFVDRAEAVGLAVKHTPHTPYEDDKKLLIPGLYSGAGTSAGDIDDDGYLDVLLGDGERCRLFRNVNGERFEDVTLAAGLDGIGKVRGAYLVDMDDDGRLDVFFTRVLHPPLLYLNQGQGRFEDASDRFQDVPPGQYESAVFADFDNDGDLDVYLVRYGNFDDVSFAFPLYNATDGVDDVLVRNDGDRLIRVRNEVVEVPGWGLAAACADYDDDGDQDLYVVNDFGVNHLYRNDGDWKFTEVTEQAGAADQGFGMSGTFGDYDGDGDLDLYVANLQSSARWLFEDPDFPLPTIAELFFRDQVRNEVFKVVRGNTLLQNQGDGTFVQKASQAGVERAEWAWGATWFDYDNDGDLDVYCPNGFVTGTDLTDT